MNQNKFEMFGSICDLLFWTIVLVSLTVFDKVFSTSFWIVISSLGVIQASYKFFKK